VQTGVLGIVQLEAVVATAGHDTVKKGELKQTIESVYLKISEEHDSTRIQLKVRGSNWCVLLVVPCTNLLRSFFVLLYRGDAGR
jgi:hypothetical protein